MTALELAPEPATQETLALLRLERKIDALQQTAEQIAAAHQALERRIEAFLGPAFDIAATLHQTGELAAKNHAASVAHSATLASLLAATQALTKTIEAALALTVGFDNDPTRRLVKV